VPVLTTTVGAGSGLLASVVVVVTVLTSSSSRATMIVSLPSAPCIRRMRRFWTFRHQTATMIRNTPSPRMSAMKLDDESVIWIYSLLS
jgi:hypothetical protein